MATTTTTSLLAPTRVCRKIYIQRDYSRGVGVRFSSTFPDDLSGRIDSDAFELMISKVNRILDDAERLSLFSVMDSLLGCITAYLIFACYDSYYDRCLKKVTRLIEEQNEVLWKPKGLLLTDPKELGLRCIEIRIFDSGNEIAQTNGCSALPPPARDLPGVQETALA